MSINIGDHLPKVTVAAKGELVLANGKIEHHPWDSTQLTGKVRVIYHIAGKTGAKELNAALIEAIKSANFPKNLYQTTTIINLNDAIWGTGAFVTSKAEGGKKEYPWSSVVLDSQGAVLDAWQLTPDSSAIILLDQHGHVLFFKDGKLSKDEISDLISDIDLALGSPSYKPQHEVETVEPVA